MKNCEIDITLEEALKRATPSLKKKIQYSVDLCQKAEKLALKYSDKGFALGFSGGKDSQATYHIAKLAGVKFVARFSPTSVDPPEIIRFIRSEYPDVEFLKIHKSIFQAAVEQGTLPTMNIRWCCAEFKENANPGTVNMVGVRKAESVRRKKRNEIEVSSHKFSGDLNSFDIWSKEKIEKIKKKYPKVNEDSFSDSESIDSSKIRCVGGKDKIIVMPIIYWSERDVWEFLNKVIQVKHCFLYDEGRVRIGCIMCPMSSTKQQISDVKRWPHVYKNWMKAIHAIRAGWDTVYGPIPSITPHETDSEGSMEGSGIAYSGYSEIKKLLVEQSGYSKCSSKKIKSKKYDPLKIREKHLENFCQVR